MPVVLSLSRNADSNPTPASQAFIWAASSSSALECEMKIRAMDDIYADFAKGVCDGRHSERMPRASAKPRPSCFMGAIPVQRLLQSRVQFCIPYVSHLTH